MTRTLPLILVLALLPAAPLAAADVTSVGLKGDGQTDDTDALQAALDAGPSEIFFPDGRYLLGTVRVPADTRLRFAPRAFVRVNGPRVETVSPLLEPEKKFKALFLVRGDRVTFDGLQIDFARFDAEDKLIDERQAAFFIYARGVRDLRVSGAQAVKPERREVIPLADRRRKGIFAGKLWHELLRAEECTCVVLENSRASGISHMLDAFFCQDVTVRGNRMESGGTMTTFAFGSQWLRHHDNWSRDCFYQVVWRGGSPDPSRKAPRVPLGSSGVVQRGSRPGDEGYNQHTVGVFDVMVQNNYAEYGNTLAWGNKGRQVLIQGNTARYISDYAFGTEGGENVVFANNVSVNSTAGSFVSMYWGEKLLVTGNTAIVRHDNWDPQFSWYPEERPYQGPFVRLHHGPTTPEDTAAGSRYGAGQVVISGNLFVNELPGVPKAVDVQAGRDVLVSGNRFTNGQVNKSGPGRLTVAQNEFAWDFADEFPCVTLGLLDDDAIVRDNILRRVPDPTRRASQDDVAYVGPGLQHTEAEAAAQSQSVRPQTAAIMCLLHRPCRLQITGNLVQGWTRSMELAAPGPQPPTALVSGNWLDGTLRLAGVWQPLVRDNVHPTTFAPVAP